MPHPSPGSRNPTSASPQSFTESPALTQASSSPAALHLVEQQGAILRKRVFSGWFLIVFLLFAGAIFFLSRLQLA